MTDLVADDVRRKLLSEFGVTVSPTCRVHLSRGATDSTMRHFCTNDLIPVCAICMSLEHSGHTCRLINEVAPVFRRHLTALTGGIGAWPEVLPELTLEADTLRPAASVNAGRTAEVELMSLVASLQDTIDRVSESANAAIEAANATHAAIVRASVARRDTLIGTVKAHRDRKRAALLMQLQGVRDAQARVASVLGGARRAAAGLSDFELSTAYGPIQSAVRSLYGRLFREVPTRPVADPTLRLSIATEDVIGALDELGLVVAARTKQDEERWQRGQRPLLQAVVARAALALEGALPPPPLPRNHHTALDPLHSPLRRDETLSSSRLSGGGGASDDRVPQELALISPVAAAPSAAVPHKRSASPDMGASVLSPPPPAATPYGSPPQLAYPHPLSMAMPYPSMYHMPPFAAYHPQQLPAPPWLYSGGAYPPMGTPMLSAQQSYHHLVPLQQQQQQPLAGGATADLAHVQATADAASHPMQQALGSPMPRRPHLSSLSLSAPTARPLSPPLPSQFAAAAAAAALEQSGSSESDYSQHRESPPQRSSRAPLLTHRSDLRKFHENDAAAAAISRGEIMVAGGGGGGGGASMRRGVSFVVSSSRAEAAEADSGSGGGASTRPRLRLARSGTSLARLTSSSSLAPKSASQPPALQAGASVSASWSGGVMPSARVKQQPLGAAAKSAGAKAGGRRLPAAAGSDGGAGQAAAISHGADDAVWPVRAADFGEDAPAKARPRGAGVRSDGGTLTAASLVADGGGDSATRGPAPTAARPTPTPAKESLAGLPRASIVAAATPSASPEII